MADRVGKRENHFLTERSKEQIKRLWKRREWIAAGKNKYRLLAEEAIYAALWDYAEKHEIQIEGIGELKSDIHEDEAGQKRINEQKRSGWMSGGAGFFGGGSTNRKNRV